MNYDIAVIGAGLAGLQCARLLASRGFRVAVLDRKASVTGPVHTTGIFVRKTWEDFPLPDEQLGPGIRDVVLHSPAGRTLALHAEQDEFRVGRMAWLQLWMLEQCTRVGVEWIPNARVLDVGTLDGQDGVTFTRNGHTERIEARFVIGADGARSTVAEQLGLDRNRELLVGLEEVIPPVSRERVLHCFVDPRLAPGYIAWLANDGEEAHIGVAGYRDRWEPAQALETLRDRLKAKPAIERRGGLIPVGGILRRIASPRGLLVGDAAGAVSPLTAGGLDGALRLSSFAAEVTAAYLERGDVRALGEYNGNRFRARFVARRWMRRAIRAVATPFAAEVALGALRMPLMRGLAEHVFFSRGSFPTATLESTRPAPAPAPGR